MGRGDKKTRRGKIFRGSFGKTRPRHKKTEQNTEEAGQSKDPGAKSEQQSRRTEERG